MDKTLEGLERFNEGLKLLVDTEEDSNMVLFLFTAQLAGLMMSGIIQEDVGYKLIKHLHNLHNIEA